MRRLFISHLLDMLVGVVSYLAARWILDLSSPSKDWAEVQRWAWWFPELRWYRGPEFYHQMRGARILSQV